MAFSFGSLKLDTNTKVSHSRDCGGRHIRLVGPVIDQEGDLYLADRWAGCNTYSCPTCGPKKIRKLRARVFKGNLAQYVSPGREDNAAKLLTLTYPGGDRRRLTEPETARREMAASFDRLIRALKKHLGPFHHLKVFEQHKDGMPHLHVVMVGDAIRPRYVLALIEELWRGHYGMGFVKLNRINDLTHAIRYVTKYLTKGAGELAGQFWSASRGALERAYNSIKVEWATFASRRSESTGKRVLVNSEETWGMVDRLHVLKFPEIKNRVFQELVQFFETQEAITSHGW